MKEIYWSFITSHQWNTDHLDCVKSLLDDVYPYENLTRTIATTRKGSTFLKCPAHTDFLKNTFVFLAPFDITLEISITDTNRSLTSINLTQEVFDKLVDIRFLEDYHSETNPFPLIGIDWLNVFTCKESVLLQVLPAFMHYNEFTQKTAVIPGEFNINKWTRPVELVFEVKSNKEKIIIKKGDAIAYFKFNSDDIVKLIPNNTPWSEIKICNDIRQANTFRPLDERYSALKKERIKQCPYESDN